MKKIIIILFLLSVFFLGFLPVKDTDFGWHYRCGNQFLETGKLCLKNEFSYFLPNYKAYNPSFLYDIALAFVYNHFGFLGVSFLGAIVIVFSAFFIFQLLSGSVWLRMIAFYLIFWLSYSIFGLGFRSQLVSFLFFVIMLYLLDKIRDNKFLLISRSKFQQISGRNLLLLFSLSFLFLIWVNSHIGFFLGLVLLGFFFVSNVSPSFMRKQESSHSGSLITLEEKPPRLDTINNDKTSEVNQVYGQPSGLSLQLFGPLTFNFFVTFLNPFGPKVYLEIFRHFQAPLNTMIAEWVAPPFWQKALIIALSILALISRFVSITKNRPRFTLVRPWQSATFPILLLLFFAILSFQARRNLPFFYTIFFYTISTARITHQLINYLIHDRSIDNLINQICLCFLISLTFVFAAINLPQTINFHQSWENYCHQGLVRYPCQAIEKTNLKKLSGHLYTAYEWGGFLIWQTPRLKVFTDGRMSAWKDEDGQYPYQVYLYILQTQPGWNEKLKRYNTDYLLIQSGTFLDLKLQINAAKYGWKQTYRDDVAVFYKKI